MVVVPEKVVPAPGRRATPLAITEPTPEGSVAVTTTAEPPATAVVEVIWIAGPVVSVGASSFARTSGWVLPSPAAMLLPAASVVANATRLPAPAMADRIDSARL